MNSRTFDWKLYKVKPVETIKQLITETIEEHPDNVAYMYKKTHGETYQGVTYAEFAEAYNSLGTELLHMGLKDAKIAVLGENSWKWALTYLTVVSGVGVIVPIDKNLEQDELKNLFERADVECVFTSENYFDKVKAAAENLPMLKSIVITDYKDAANLALSDNVFVLDDLIARGLKLLNESDNSFVLASPRPNDLSTILFTSGTTGLAKGVMLSQNNLAQNVVGASRYFHVPQDGRVLSVLPMHHAYEMTCTVLTVFYQAKTVVICEGLKHVQSNFVEAGCCTMLGVPLIFENIHKKIFKQAVKTGEIEQLMKGIDFVNKWGLKNRKLLTNKIFKSIHDIFGKNLHCLIAGGAGIDPSVIRDFEAMGIPIIQGYGMTECAPLISVNQDRYSKAASVGRPLLGTEVELHDVDDKGIGEIVCKGPSVMMGYYKDPKSTDEVLKDGWLNTGDFGYIDRDGFIYITGRKKNVIVTKGGKNIFPEEIEFYLYKYDIVADCIVYGKEHLIEDDLVTSVIVCPNKSKIKELGLETNKAIYEEIRRIVEEINSLVPAYKRVKHIEIRENDFIKTTTLKIKRFEQDNYIYDYEDRDFDETRRF